MSKSQTKEIQNLIKDLGEHLGFISKTEVTLVSSYEYSPIYDVVWYIDLKNYFHLDILKKYIDENVIENIKLLPIAVFEIEGSATSSKKQIGNAINLTFSNAFLKFLIVNNEQAIPEKDTYRRGLKIIRYYQNNIGYRNFIFLDWNHIKDSFNWLKISNQDKIITFNQNQNLIRKGSGGESESIEAYKKIIDDLIKTKLELKQDYTPEMCKFGFLAEDYIGKNINTENKEVNFYLKKIGFKDPVKYEIYNLKRITDRYYLPKLDIVLGFNLPKSIIKWLTGLGRYISYDIINNPIIFYLNQARDSTLFVPLISFEIETSVSKHLNGGIVNMSKNSYIGVLISKKEAIRHIEFFKKQGLNNIYFYDYESGGLI
jgi:hypothetical protein